MKGGYLAGLCALLFLALSGCATTKPALSPEELFRDGEQLFKREKYEDAIAQWKKVKESYHSPELSARAEIGIADAYFLNRDYIESASAYEDFRKLHPRSEKAGYALFRQGVSSYHQITGIDTDQTPVKNARATLQSYLELYPGGESVQEAREKLTDCRDKQLQYEIYVGRFYLRTEKYPAAIGRFEAAAESFPDLPRKAEALYGLVSAYRESGERDKAVAAYERLMKEFPGSRYTADAGRELGK